MRRTTVFGVAAAATLCATAALAVQDGQTQDAGFTPEMMKAMSPGPAHAKLAKLEGDYDIVLEWRMSPEAPWETLEFECEREMIMDGRFLQEDIEGEFMGNPFHGKGLLGFDNVREEYTNVWFDNSSTGIMISTGTARDDGSIVLEGTGSDPMTGEKDKWSRSVMSADGNNFEMFAKTPDGAEFKSMTITYARK